MKIELHPIGVIHSPYTSVNGMPIQPAGAAEIRGDVEVFARFADGLRDLDGFSHVILVYYFHRSGEPALTVTPFLDKHPRGIFATRAPKRPNPIGISTVRLLAIEGNRLHIQGVDILDGTPLLDIKPYVPAFDRVDGVRTGWLEKIGASLQGVKSDDRFSPLPPKK
jgi:tRNA-Thr(GGU) m(6)t(6)A37 methyltransferase TsaA